MNHLKAGIETPRGQFSAAEWKSRVDLAAAYRLCSYYGWDNLIYNHIALRVPDQPDHFLFKPHPLMFDEICASNLLKIPLNHAHFTEEDGVNAAGFTIHSALLKSRADINCTLHVHTKAGMAMSAHKTGLISITQGAMRFHNRLSYHGYEGISTDISECDRLAADLGEKNKAMILRNHGMLTCGTSASEAITLMRYLLTACETQMMLEATGAEIIIPSDTVCEHAAQQWDHHDANGGKDDWPAYLRIVDRLDPGFRE